MKKLLLHTCCAPCLTALEERLRNVYNKSTFWFNPNIEPEKEHDLRLQTYKLFCDRQNIQILFENNYRSDNNLWSKCLRASLPNALSSCREGRERCEQCILFRLEETAKTAKRDNFDIFSTTLSISPYKSYRLISTIGKKLSKKYNISFLDVDFKKQNGYIRSIELSKEFNLYRQKYCGCSYSNRTCSPPRLSLSSSDRQRSGPEI